MQGSDVELKVCMTYQVWLITRCASYMKDTLTWQQHGQLCLQTHCRCKSSMSISPWHDLYLLYVMHPMTSIAAGRWPMTFGLRLLLQGGPVAAEEGTRRYADSVESLVRNNIQKAKIDMANEVIDAGRFDMQTSMGERKLVLENLLQVPMPCQLAFPIPSDAGLRAGHAHASFSPVRSTSW